MLDVTTLDRVVPPPQPNSDVWSRVILDAQGTIAARNRSEANYVGSAAREEFRARLRQRSESVSSETTRDGVALYAAVSPSRFGWSAVVTVPRSVLDAPLLASLVAVMIGGAVLMLCGLAAGTRDVTATLCQSRQRHSRR